MKRENMFLLALEGSDGTGKETQTGLLCTRLERAGHRVLRLDFPAYGKTKPADDVREFLRNPAKRDAWFALPWRYKASLYAMDRHLIFEMLAGRAHEAPSVIVCNRYVPSNQAYMAASADSRHEWSERFEWITTLEYDLLQLPRPGVVLFLTMPTDVSSSLLHTREAGHVDAHEANRPYLQRVHDCFVELSQRESDTWVHIPNDTGGRVEKPAEVHERLWASIERHPAWQTFLRVSAPALASPSRA
jgi:dTMP kinase